MLGGASGNDGEVGRMPKQHVEDLPNRGGNGKGFQTVRRGGKTAKAALDFKSVQFASRGRLDGSTAIKPAGADDGSSRCIVSRKRKEASFHPKPMVAVDGSIPEPAPRRSPEAWNEWLKCISGIIKDSGGHVES